MGLIEWGILFIKETILDLGYAGIAFLMALDGACVPVPSEIVMPFAGWLAYKGELDLIAVSLAGTIGCTLGSIATYAVGLYGGRAFILKYGKYVMLSERSLISAEKWFSKYGNSAVFFARLVPVIRSFISLPAGIAKMNFAHFTVLSFLGTLPWCFALAYAGYALGPSWEGIVEVFRDLDVLILLGIVIILAWFLWRRRKKSSDHSE
ncbi:MAG: DedA family protein [Euryarchaeota archaeon]|nr:DedA family protein [Euryarchaeota archaeon]